VGNVPLPQAIHTPATQRSGRDPAAAPRTLDASAFPHILDTVIALSDHTSLLALRTISREVRETVDARMARHLVVRDKAIAPAGMDGWHPSLSYLKRGLAVRRLLRGFPKHRYPKHQEATVELLKKHTRTIDIETNQLSFMNLLAWVLEGEPDILVRVRFHTQPMVPTPFASIGTYIVRLPLDGNTLWRQALPPAPSNLPKRHPAPIHKAVLHLSACAGRIEGYTLDPRTPIKHLVLVIHQVDREVENTVTILEFVWWLRYGIRTESLTVVYENADLRPRFKQAFRDVGDHSARSLTLPEYEAEVGPQRFRLEVDP
jgi:hypothetical protein